MLRNWPRALISEHDALLSYLFSTLALPIKPHIQHPILQDLFHSQMNRFIRIMDIKQPSLPTTEPLGTSTGPRRSRNGCQQCRKRKRKCDEQHPRCLACVERQLPCNWRREPRRHQVARRHHQFNKDFTLPKEMRPLVTVFAVPSTSIQERLLSYFNTNSPLWLTSGGNVEECSGIIIPVALRNPLVMNCVLTLAAGDWGKYQPASTEMATLACGFYGQAIAGVNAALSHEVSASSSSGSASPEKTSWQSSGNSHHSLLLLPHVYLAC